MLGRGAGQPDHNQESEIMRVEIERGGKFSQKLSRYCKIIAVGNEAMVRWANSYYVQPRLF